MYNLNVTKYTGNIQDKGLIKLRLDEFLYILNADGSLKKRQLFMREEEK
jgi:hypothetical protein